ncbi:AAA family ATPase [Actinoplanes sp. CA-252034]|uniref:AAA family ATPase n=1 Tax=Actinoplanes sp. CA-252034 TaxID=3239906 RepID=UPI003D96AB02
MRYGHGLIVGKFYPPHAGHHALIDAAAQACERVTVVVAPSSRESIPLADRLAWLRAEHGPRVRFAGVLDDHPVDYADPAVWELHMAVFRAAAGTDRVDAVFSSEAYGTELAHRFHAEAVLVDPDRGRIPVSGTAIRADPVAHWDRLRAGARGWLARRVIVVGAESTGTTTTARALARHFRLRGGVWAGTRWVPEFGRELTERKLADLRKDRPEATVFDVTWDRADFRAVAAEQNAAEDAAAGAGSPVLFGDTDAFATTIWEERYLGSSSPEVREFVRSPDLYLLTDCAGVPFEDDGLRDGEHLRQWMTDRFRSCLAAGDTPWQELTGGTATACAPRWRRSTPYSPRGGRSPSRYGRGAKDGPGPADR